MDKCLAHFAAGIRFIVCKVAPIAQVGAAVKLSNFRKDVDASGTITQADVTTTQGQVGTSIP
jgi:hypothetical protein